MGNLYPLRIVMQHSKKCFKCGLNKPLSDFYAHKQMADGHLNKCKDCTKKDTKLNCEKNADYYREYSRVRAYHPKRVEYRKRYSQTPEGRESAARAKKKWAESNVIKRSANCIVNNALKSGKLVKPNKCESCLESDVVIHGHHDDYAYPMDVRWLCASCHSEWHRLNGQGRNG